MWSPRAALDRLTLVSAESVVSRWSKPRPDGRPDPAAASLVPGPRPTAVVPSGGSCGPLQTTTNPSPSAKKLSLLGTFRTAVIGDSSGLRWLTSLSVSSPGIDRKHCCQSDGRCRCRRRPSEVPCTRPREMALLLALQPSRAFNQGVPAEHERGHETIHLQVAGGAVVDGRLVAEGQIQVLIDRVT